MIGQARIAALLAMLAAAVSSGGDQEASRWDGRLAEAKSFLRTNRFAEAREACDQVVASALSSNAPAAEVRAALAAATACRSVAYRRTMQPWLGEWEWYVAASLSPDVATRWRAEERGCAGSRHRLWWSS